MIAPRTGHSAAQRLNSVNTARFGDAFSCVPVRVGSSYFRRGARRRVGRRRAERARAGDGADVPGARLPLGGRGWKPHNGLRPLVGGVRAAVLPWVLGGSRTRTRAAARRWTCVPMPTATCPVWSGATRVTLPATPLRSSSGARPPPPRALSTSARTATCGAAAGWRMHCCTLVSCSGCGGGRRRGARRYLVRRAPPAPASTCWSCSSTA